MHTQILIEHGFIVKERSDGGVFLWNLNGQSVGPLIFSHNEELIEEAAKAFIKWALEEAVNIEAQQEYEAEMMRQEQMMRDEQEALERMSDYTPED